MPSYTTGLLLIATVLAAVFACFRVRIWWTQDKNEPPVLGNSIPFLSPVLGIARQRTNFMVQLRDKCPSVPIYTLRLPGSRIYVINSPSLASVVQRQKRVIAFEPIPAQAAARMMGVSKAGVEVISRNCTTDESYFGTFLRATYPALAPGNGLEAMNRAAVEVLAVSMERLERWEGEGEIKVEIKEKIKVTEVDLWDWVRHEVLMATTEAIYGPDNPFRDPANERAWYELEQGIVMQMMQVHSLFPSGRSSFRARESLVQAFRRYFAYGAPGGCHPTPAPDSPSLSLVQARYRHNLSQGLSRDDIARTEIGQVAASLSNTIPAAFWMLWHVLSDPVVLADCRDEIERLVTVDLVQQKEPEQEQGLNGRAVQKEREVCTIDLAQLTNRQVCPVITSTWYEVLRFNHVGIAARVVMQDTLVDGYLLKKDSTAMIVSPVMHSDLSVWGPSAREFCHCRFIQTHSNNNNSDRDDRSTTATDNSQERSHKAKRGNLNPEKSPANRIFGGGSTLCPGRHFASQEVLSLLALTIMRFDVRPVGNGVLSSAQRPVRFIRPKNRGFDGSYKSSPRGRHMILNDLRRRIRQGRGLEQERTYK
ncbi:hypothetical protein G7Y89_g14296 [Cudoniella acicularis]|uniref:Cytochrome P450 n=1 Tax=Cudoniella acicularis TaxID=354080 RepID=A0A8H4R3G2_9HELO|nr:hypothetical protein G7Y89_g14296 [Cudoniella acicularis]